ncbi:MAG: hypothetical protein V7L26_21390 [Nostoc sp.]|uniref:hypothetical protein n=1 Tax=Nostoc sp. TaxID=1180 RepID=UPI002FF72DCB
MIQQIKVGGEIAPPGCCVSRYQARGKQGVYWYYKLHATHPIFSTTQPEKLSKYRHLGISYFRLVCTPRGYMPIHFRMSNKTLVETAIYRVSKPQNCCQ